jgi:hypothetical protein
MDYHLCVQHWQALVTLPAVPAQSNLDARKNACLHLRCYARTHTHKQLHQKVIHSLKAFAGFGKIHKCASDPSVGYASCTARLQA